jgi:hypothetical protein
MMDVQFTFLSILMVGLLVLGGASLVLVAVFATRRRNAPRLTAIPSAPPSREARGEILQQLSERRISVDEAEARLAALGNPVPANFPQHASASPSAAGCLTAGLAGVALIVCGGIALLAVFRLSYSRASMNDHPASPAEVLQDVPSDLTPSLEAATNTEAEVTEEMIETWEEETE